MCKTKGNLIFIMLIIFSTRISYSQESEKPDNSMEVRLGWEMYRHSLTGVLGHSFYVDDKFSLVPELNYITSLTLSGSLRYELPIDQKMKFYLQGGFGVTYILPLLPSGLIAVGTKYDLNKTVSLTIDNRILLMDDLDSDLSVGGIFSFSEIKNIKKFPPWTLSLGITF